MLKRLLKSVLILSAMLAILGIVGGVAVIGILYHYGRDLPDYKQLANYEPPTTTRIYAGDGELITQYAVQDREFVPVDAIPKRVIHAFLSAEDKNFYSHPGIDITGMIRAFLTDLQNIGTDRRPSGGSTITQQVAKNFLLTNAVTLSRKIKEAILSFRIEHSLSKDRILELYLNEIYLGYGSYGIAAAALNYFDKSLDQLTIPEAAFLAALPKAPSNYNPVRHHQAALDRRNWVIDRMQDDGYITAQEAQQAKAQPLVVKSAEATHFVKADYFVEDVRRELLDRYGENELYKGGLAVRTTLDPHLQKLAREALRDGLVAYDRRHGYRGPIATLTLTDDWAQQLSQVKPPAGLSPWVLAVTLSVGPRDAKIGFANGDTGHIPFAELQWARPCLKNQRVGPPVRRPSDVLAPGDVVAVQAVSEDADGKPYPAKTYALRQIPNVDGAIMAMDPHTGRVLAMDGGYSYAMSEFNRATQAERQPGSAFKPFVYAAALDDGFTPSTLVLDAPIVIDQGPGLPKWKPENYTREFYGLVPMRIGIEDSRNLMTIRMAQTIGMDKVAAMAEKFGVVDKLPLQLSMALGAVDTTLLRLTTGYAMFVNGGKKITPTLIDRVQDRHGKTIFKHDMRPCDGCQTDGVPATFKVPVIPDLRPQIEDPRTAFQVVSLLEGVVQRGTGRRIRSLGIPLAGKTGTTNDSFDTWFIGFSPDLVAGVYVGFDQPRTLGRETGASVAVPIFRQFMGAALAGKPAIPFRVPPGIILVRVDEHTGKLPPPGDKNVILEAFKPGTEPTGPASPSDVNSMAPDRTGPAAVPGGLY